jgi:hypothetical protein
LDADVVAQQVYFGSLGALSLYECSRTEAEDKKLPPKEPIGFVHFKDAE